MIRFGARGNAVESQHVRPDRWVRLGGERVGFKFRLPGLDPTGVPEQSDSRRSLGC